MWPPSVRFCPATEGPATALCCPCGAGAGAYAARAAEGAPAGAPAGALADALAGALAGAPCMQDMLVSNIDRGNAALVPLGLKLQITSSKHSHSPWVRWGSGACSRAGWRLTVEGSSCACVATLISSSHARKELAAIMAGVGRSLALLQSLLKPAQGGKQESQLPCELTNASWLFEAETWAEWRSLPSKRRQLTSLTSHAQEPANTPLHSTELRHH